MREGRVRAVPGPCPRSSPQSTICTPVTHTSRLTAEDGIGEPFASGGKGGDKGGAESGALGAQSAAQDETCSIALSSIALIRTERRNPTSYRGVATRRERDAQCKVENGPEWTRTTDLTLISA